MKRLKVKVQYYDTQAKKTMLVGEVFEVDDKRAEELLKNPYGIVELTDQEIIEPKKPISKKFKLNPKLKKTILKNKKTK